ncbi:DUF302 domain-containing protein [bacterium]|nr:DUF302 domain-containing protein [bacterium]MBU1993889.1 DUF302 domain-containing protein [bacterium]
MKKLLLIVACGITLLANDIIIKQSKYSVSQTIENIKDIVKSKGMGVFAIINHQGNAGMVGMQIQESKLIIFGNPELGTPLMQENILASLDLPLKVLVYRDSENKVKLAYRNATWLQGIHGFKNNEAVMKIDEGLDKITDKASK